MLVLIPLSFLPLFASLIFGAAAIWQRLLLLAPLALLLVHLWGYGLRWQLAPVYALSAGMLLFMLFTRGFWLLPNWLLVTVLTMTVLLISLSSLLLWVFPDVPLPSPRGSLPVGTTVRTFDDVSVRLWYPASAEGDAVPYRYLEGVKTGVLGLPGFLHSHLRNRPTAAQIDAPLSQSRDTYPVIIYLYGAASFPEDNSFRLMELASQGFVVAAVRHAKPFSSYGLTMTDALESESFAQRLAEGAIPDGVRDVRVAVAGLEELNDADPHFRGRLALSRLGLLGYSLGGSVASEYCLETARCRAVVSLDGSGFARARHAGAGAAYLQSSQSVALPLAAPENPQTAAEKVSAYYRAEVSDLLRHTRRAHPTYWFRLEGSGHGSFTDLLHWTPRRFGVLGMMLGSAEPDVLQETLDEVTVAFFREHLLEETGFAEVVARHAHHLTSFSF